MRILEAMGLWFISLVSGMLGYRLAKRYDKKKKG